MCWISTRSPTIRTSQSSASTSYPTRWWPRNVRPCPKSLDARSATTTSTSARVCSTSSRSSSPRADGGIWTLPSDVRRWISPWLCGGWWRSTIPNREGAGGPRQPKHSQPGLVVQGVRAGGSQAPVAPAGVPPHPQARLLAEHGGDRALGALSAVFGASHPRCREAYKGDWGLGAQAQRRRGDGAMALHGIRRSGEAGTPLSGTTVVVEY